MLTSRQRISIAAASLAAIVSCSDPGARAQLLVVVDTDMPTLLQVEADPSLSRDVAVDALRVDLIDVSGSLLSSRDFVAPSALDWPISFGVEPATAAVTARLRVYRSSLATPRLANGATVLEPSPVTTVDRLVTLPKPTSGVAVVPITLRGDCIGSPVSFTTPLATCIDADRLTGPPDVPQIGSAPEHTAAGTWPVAHEVDCAAPPPNADALCVPGGLSLMGDAELNGLTGQTLPYRLALLSPFYMDRTEFTVGRYRAALAAQTVRQLPTPDPIAANPEDCIFTNVSVTTKDAYPLNCLDQHAAVTACLAMGGLLPTESQYEHAARGRGQGRRFPWGDVTPSCCTSDLDRMATPCAGSTGIDPAGSHPAADGCDGLGDESRDGILDLGGSLEEWMLDGYGEFTAPCWTWSGYRTDPQCDAPATYVVRGGSYRSSVEEAAAAEHAATLAGGDPSTGFRCVYPGTP